MSRDDDAADVRRALAGDEDGFAGLVGRWQGPLVNLAYRFRRDPAEAEEMAQEAFVKAFRALGRWRGEGAFSTWLFSVAVNSYRSHLRRRRPQTVPIDQLAGAGSSWVEGRLERAERDRLVRRAVAGLPARYREAVVLFYFHEMNLAETARSLGRPPNTVKSHLHRGRKMLERRLGALLQPPPDGGEIS